jgi:hypothetical protein
MTTQDFVFVNPLISTIRISNQLELYVGEAEQAQSKSWKGRLNTHCNENCALEDKDKCVGVILASLIDSPLIYSVPKPNRNGGIGG